MIALGANAQYLDQHYIPAPARQEQGLINWNYQADVPRKPVMSEGLDLQYITVTSWFSNEARATLNGQITSLKRVYAFADEAVVTDFLISHRAIRTVLENAVPQLQAAFGGDKLFNLEVSRDEDGSETLYATAIWREDVRRASEALHDFLENWWLRRMNSSTSDLAFIYKLV